jgi:hypothetical protein
LFAATGWAHHPYELTFAPNRLPRHRDQWVTIANLNDLGRLLRRIHQRYAQASGRVPLYLTEFGYQTNPPDRLGVTPALQARYLDQSEYIAWRNPAVRTLAQFLLVDDGPPIGTTFQSGLMTADGKPKPAFNSYAMPVWLPREHLRRGERLPVWGLVRAAPDGQAQRVAVQVRDRGAAAWRTVQTVTTDARRGYLSTRIAVRRSGALRLAWVSGATTRLSRTASFSVGVAVPRDGAPGARRAAASDLGAKCTHIVHLAPRPARGRSRPPTPQASTSSSGSAPGPWNPRTRSSSASYWSVTASHE